MKEKRYVINGKPLLFSVTGVQRYLMETVRRLDPLVEPGKIEFVFPEGSKPPVSFKNIKIVYLPRRKEPWAMCTVARYCKANQRQFIGMACDPCPPCGGIVCLHDIRPLLYPNKGLAHKDDLLYYWNSRQIVKNARIVSVSHTAAEEIERYFQLPLHSISVIYDGWEHITEYSADNNIFTRWPQLRKSEYYYALGSRYPYKNYKWIEQLAKKNPQMTFAVSGKSILPRSNENIPNVCYLGYTSDAENKALMQNCHAFLHPSTYEGFGVPPLEALACGAPILLANNSCLPEIYGKCARYFDPNDYDVDLETLLRQPVDPPDTLLKRYTWENAAHMWFDLL